MPSTRDILTSLHTVTEVTYTTSADMTSATDIAVAPPTNQNIQITDVLIASDTAMLFEFLEEDTGTVLAALRLFANNSYMLSPKGHWNMPTNGKNLQGKAGASGNVYITVWYTYE